MRIGPFLLVLPLAFAAGLSTAGAYTFKVLHSFCAEANCADGSTPYGSVTVDSAGRLYGTASLYGKFAGGVVFEMTPIGSGAWDYKMIHNFCKKDGCPDGALPVGTLIVSTSGALYGTTNVGGKIGYGYGTLFRLSPNADRSRWSHTLLHNFCDPTQCSNDGGQPFSGATYTGAASGLPYDEVSPLYGLTYAGGLNHGGTAYELKPRSGRKKWHEKLIYNFCSQANCTDGGFPFGSLTPDISGQFFGSGGFGDVVFELTPSRKQKESVLYSFCSLANCADGNGPGDLVLDANGNLLGTTVAGGTCSADSNGCGVIFRLTPGKPWQETVLYNFCTLADCADGRNGAGPYGAGAMLIGPDGTLFGTTTAGGGHDIGKDGKGGGTVFALNGSSLQVLYAFCAEANCADGELPLPHLAMDSAGNLYGTTFYGGAYGAGEVFELSP